MTHICIVPVKVTGLNWRDVLQLKFLHLTWMALSVNKKKTLYLGVKAFFYPDLLLQ